MRSDHKHDQDRLMTVEIVSMSVMALWVKKEATRIRSPRFLSQHNDRFGLVF